jgi:predicted TIM-barrel fold metal-dependent hydrolase
MLTRRRFLAQSAAGVFALSGCPIHSALFAEWVGDHESQSTSQPTTLLIDSHVHVFERNPRFPFAPGAQPPAEDAPPEKLIDLMRANGVSRTVIIQVIHYKWDNSFLLSVLKHYPKLFHGVCRVNPEDPAAPDELAHLTEEGFRGVRLSPAADATGDWIRGPLMPPLWRRCSELKVPMTVLAPATRLPDLVPLIEANPELTVVIDHMADCPLDRPDLLEHLLDLARYPRVFVKISDMWSLSKQSYPYPDAQDQVKRLLERFSAQRLMWATNWPVSLAQLPYAKIVELYRDHLRFLTPEEREAILSKTVQRVWPFGL